MRYTNVHNILHYPGQVLYYDIARISHIIESTQYGKHALFIAYADGVPAGIAGITYAGENVHLYILPEYRGYGIGRKLVQDRVCYFSIYTTSDGYVKPVEISSI